ncbi:MAG: hypothetical protein ACOYL6_14405 [Bacteriovoracaceae bacterium]
MKLWLFSFLIINSIAAYGQDLLKDCKMNSEQSSISCGDKIFTVGISKELNRSPVDNTLVVKKAERMLFEKFGLLAGCSFQDTEKLIIHCRNQDRSQSYVFTQVSVVTPTTKVVQASSDTTNNSSRTTPVKGGRGVAGFVDQPFVPDSTKTKSNKN